MPTLLDLDTPTLAAICSQLSFKDVLALRTASSHHLEAVARVMDHTLEHILRRFVEDTSGLKSALVRLNSFIGGAAAVAYFMRDGSVVPKALDVFTPYWNHDAFVDELKSLHGAKFIWAQEAGDIIGEHLEHCGLAAITYLATTKGLVTVYRSQTNNPLVPIVRGWSSAVTNFVHPHFFGCGYPLLLFRRRALVGVGHRREAGHVRAYTQRGFDLRLASHQWPDHAHPRCAAQFWCCPLQARSFTDPGALFSRVRPLQASLPNITITWRLDFRPCGSDCVRDGALRWWELCRPSV